MNQQTEYVRSDTPDPRVAAFNIEDMSSVRPHMDISSAWHYMGTNNSALRGSSLNRPLSEELRWVPSAGGLTENTMSQYSASGLRYKRHWQSDDRFRDDPPCKVRINEEKVAQQFHSMSLHTDNLPACSSSSPSSTCSNTVSAMWDRYLHLEQKLESAAELDIDEGVDMGADSTNFSETQEPLLHVIPDLKVKLRASLSLPQIFVPKPCKEVVLWQPSGMQLLKGSASSTDLSSEPSSDEVSLRKKKTATRTISPNPSLLTVPTVRPDTPPPNSRTSPLCHDIPVCFIDEPADHSDMEMQ